MKLFQKSIPVLLVFFFMGLCSGTAAAQASVFPAFFDKDSIASFRLLSTTGKKLTYKSSGKLSLFVFLSPDCPLCKNYASLLNTLQHDYQTTINFYLIVPGSAYSMKELKNFSNAYLKNAMLYKDAALNLSYYLRATVTPQVVLLETETGKAVYTGALDNWAVSLGKQRLKATETYLQDAIERYLHNQPVAMAYKEPVGCLINDF